ncbi:MAG TPA: ATP-binding protein [Anaerolineae bacterium]|nr:ATP-binding protein [Anaerolineae bacterium]
MPPGWADRRRVEQVFSNLIRNAVKFSPEGSLITISLQAQAGALQTCVLDEGPGVAPEEQALIFDKFYTTNKNQALAGVGLGLFICRRLIEQSGGKIWIKNRSQGGSAFCFTLPLANEEPDNAKSRPKNSDN